MKLVDRDFLLNWLGAIRVKQIDPAYEEAYKFVSSVVKDKRFIIEAIPLEWIKKWVNRWSIDLSVSEMLKDWEKEQK